MFLSPKRFGQSDMVLWDLMIMMSGLLGVLMMSDIFEFLIYTEEVWFQLWISLKKHKRIDKRIS